MACRISAKYKIDADFMKGLAIISRSNHMYCIVGNQIIDVGFKENDVGFKENEENE